KAGVILGTAAYMSPEQARGENTDSRTDILSFGCVLFEMLTSRQAFQGKTVSDVIASVLTFTPDFSLLPAKLNPKILQLLHRALDKKPKRRWQAAAAMRMEIDEIITEGPFAVGERAAERKPLWKRAIPAFVTSVLLSAITGLVVWNSRPPAPAIVTRFSF